jgi:hypothetical protein
LRIQQHQIEIASHSQMLETIIEQYDIRTKHFNSVTHPLRTTGRHNNAGCGIAAREQPRFVTCMLHVE